MRSANSAITTGRSSIFFRRIRSGDDVMPVACLVAWSSPQPMKRHRAAAYAAAAALARRPSLAQATHPHAPTAIVIAVHHHEGGRHAAGH